MRASWSLCEPSQQQLTGQCVGANVSKMGSCKGVATDVAYKCGAGAMASRRPDCASVALRVGHSVPQVFLV